MSDNTFHITHEELRAAEAKESKAHGGNVLKDSEVSGMKSYMDTEVESEQEKIDRVQANLPLPDDPVGGGSASLESMDARTVNVGSGGVDVKLGTESSSGLREPATAESSARVDGDVMKKPTEP